MTKPKPTEEKPRATPRPAPEFAAARLARDARILRERIVKKGKEIEELAAEERSLWDGVEPIVKAKAQRLLEADGEAAE